MPQKQPSKKLKEDSILNEKFLQILREKYHNYIKKNKILIDAGDTMLHYLVSQNLISIVQARRYVVISEVERMIKETSVSKTEAIKEVTSFIDISEKQGWNIIREYSRLFDE